jgi:UDP-N-acetylmuramoyl-L-alanyl-D-glutamate--2,6-diaminopimelate ligase
MSNDMIPKIYPVACHTDNVGPGSTFVAIQGMKQDGLVYIPAALEKGARTIVVDTNAVITYELLALLKKHNAQLVRVENTRAALASLSAHALSSPAKKLKIIAVTGTKGKSTTTFLLEHILRSAGKKTAMLSTVLNRIDGVDIPTKLTTQQPDYLHVFFDACVKQHIEWVVMEVAAQAFTLHRVNGLNFDMAIFTNFSQEHGEFYATMEDYFAAKEKIIDHLKSGAPLLVNADDDRVMNLGVRYDDTYCFSHTLYTCPALIGSFNQYNIAAAVTAASHIGLQRAIIQQALDTFTGVPGRLEKYQLPNGALGIIDYAHNPSSFEAVLGELKKLTDHLIVVFGCGGERDSSKRPVMGEIASRIADVVIITADNPRTENCATINEHICAGVASDNKNKVLIEEDREQAIRLAYARSRKGSIIVLLGKGPDEYQIIQGVTYPLSEKAILKSL